MQQDHFLCHGMLIIIVYVVSSKGHFGIMDE